MNKHAATALTLLLTTGCLAAARTAHAQTRVYVTGNVFAEITRLSRTTVTPELIDSASDIVNPDDGTTVGGGARLGAFFPPVWSLEVGFDAGKAIVNERSRSIGGPSTLLVPPTLLQYTARTSQRFAATSVLVGYHPVVRGRIQPGFRGGVSFMHAERQFTVASISSITFTPIPPIGGIVLPRITLLSNEYTVVSNSLTATLVAEAAFDLFDHFAVVAEMRAHAGGIGGFLLRPGVALRWRW
jgi:Outer membrane protein beta-barrel domain